MADGIGIGIGIGDPLVDRSMDSEFVGRCLVIEQKEVRDVSVVAKIVRREKEIGLWGENAVGDSGSFLIYRALKKEEEEEIDGIQIEARNSKLSELKVKRAVVHGSNIRRAKHHYWKHN